jgi:hypothetical protein
MTFPPELLSVPHMYHNRDPEHCVIIKRMEPGAEEPVIYFSILYVGGGASWPMVFPCRGVCDPLNPGHVFLILVSFILYRKTNPCLFLLNMTLIATRSASQLHARNIGPYTGQSESAIPCRDVKVMAIQYTTCVRWITTSTVLYVRFPWLETG